jgi:hypothetical protein
MGAEKAIQGKRENLFSHLPEDSRADLARSV